MNRIVLINGAPGSGKDTLGVELQKHYSATHKTKIFRFKDGLYEYAHSYIKHLISFDDFMFMCTNRFLKDVPNEMFFDLSPREFLIFVSEKHAKKTKGENVWVNHFIEDYSEYIEDHKGSPCMAIVTDLGFKNELDRLVESYQFNINIIRIERTGCSFDGDSRNYVKSNIIDPIHVYNDSSVKELVEIVVQELNERFSE